MNHETTETECELDEDPALAIAQLLGIINRLTAERDRARATAAALEAECSQCWGPMHTSAVDRLPEGEI